MTLTLLLDLDNTLLGNDMDTFIPPYLQGLGRALGPHLESPFQAVEAILAATQNTVDNIRTDLTLREVFETHFYHEIGLPIGSLQAVLSAYYEQEYPALKNLTRFQPEAITLVECALDRGYQVVIATNPLFPQIAVEQRLAWAGLDAQVYPFDHISSLENSHFAKPNPAYYAEILALLGWPDGPLLMVGDDLARDIQPTTELGVANYWVNANSRTDGSISPRASGSLEGVVGWIDQSDRKALLPHFDTPAAILATLRATPAALSTLALDKKDAAWQQRPAQDEWNLTEIACHLRDVESQVHLPRVQKILAENNPFIPGVDTDSWVDSRKYFCQDGKTALQDFFSHRRETLALIENTLQNDWKRPARHAIFGPTHFQELCNFMAEHDRLHLSQVRQTLSQQ